MRPQTFVTSRQELEERGSSAPDARLGINFGELDLGVGAEYDSSRFVFFQLPRGSPIYAEPA